MESKITQDTPGDVHVINVNNVRIESQPVVKLLGINIDCTLSFSTHISEICSKAVRKLNVLARLSSTLDYETRCYCLIILLFLNLITVLLYGTTVEEVIW